MGCGKGMVNIMREWEGFNGVGVKSRRVGGMESGTPYVYNYLW